ncbi:MAG: YhdH/YhfP family quinone oxidoreductase [Proteobacteria bacterium]|nr:YhdH/YhfP family quinone oxidoreductase [Pseudomonadota bacterium]MBU1738508.1 YhdH/YhfP family quinone oxidoreductase [Pseudomonadota bacterium]
MTGERFRALVVRENQEGVFTRGVEERSVDDLPPGEVLVRVMYSSLNYKDGLSASGNRGVTRRYPHTPGVDAAGIVAECVGGEFRPGDEVVVSCYDLGMNTSGGFGQYIRVPAGWVMKLPDGLSLKESMIYGTGGFTAAHSVWRLIQGGVKPEHGKVLVTGATGGVGIFSVGILAKAGYEVTAVTGKESAVPFLKERGAAAVITREEATDRSGRMILKGRWSGVVDTVGGELLSTALRSVRYGGVVTCCGNVAGPEFSANVFPFILRGISLLGIDSAECPMALRKEIWQKIGSDWKLGNLESICREVDLDGLDDEINRIMKGGIQGRVVVRI